jgi:phosphatidylinositol-3-phosphatase
MTGLPAALSMVALVATLGCSSQSRVADRPVHPASTVRASASVPAVPAATGPEHRPTKLLLVVEENHTEHAARRGMPFLARLGNSYGHTTHYRALAHPSLPNYLALAGGSTFGIRDDRNPSAHRIRGRSVFDQALATHHSARAYAESMPTRCALTNSGRYAVRHNPWTYFADATSRSNCRHHDVPAGTVDSGALHHDVVTGRLPTIGMLTPNLCDDAHDCSLAIADHWLKRWVTAIRRGPDWTSGRLAVVVTFDENNGSRPDTVLTTVLSRSTHDVVSSEHFTHYSWTRYADHLIGAHPLRHALHAHSLRKAFGL